MVLHFGLISLNILPELLWFVQMKLCSPKLCCHVLSERRGFLLETPPNKLKRLIQSFSNCAVLNFNMAVHKRSVCVIMILRDVGYFKKKKPR